MFINGPRVLNTFYVKFYKTFNTKIDDYSAKWKAWLIQYWYYKELIRKAWNLEIIGRRVVQLTQML